MAKSKIEVEKLTPLDTRDMGDGKNVMVLNPFRVKVAEHYTDGMIEVRVIEVPKGFISDYASVPRMFQWIVPRFGKYNAAAVVHDWLFEHGKIEGSKIGRSLTDRIFLAIMKKSKCRRWRRKLMYRMVRMFGYSLWKKNRKNEVQTNDNKR